VVKTLLVYELPSSLRPPLTVCLVIEYWSLNCLQSYVRQAHVFVIKELLDRLAARHAEIQAETADRQRHWRSTG